MDAPSRVSAVSDSGATASSSREEAKPPQSSARNLVINFSKGDPTVPENFEENTVEMLKKTIYALFLKERPPCNLQMLYQDINDICSLKKGKSLYEVIQTVCEIHLSNKLGHWASSVYRNKDDLALLASCWQDFYDVMVIIQGVACGVDSTHALQHRGVFPLWDMSMQLFHKHAFPSAEVVDRVVSGMIEMINNDRLCKEDDRTLLNCLMKMVKALGIYAESFEKAFLKDISAFYEGEGASHMQQLDVPDYLKYIERRLYEENERFKHTLDASSRKPLIAIVERKLLKPYTSEILDKGLLVLLDRVCIEDLQRLYGLYARVNALEPLLQAFKSCIERTCQSFLKEKGEEMVPSLLGFKESLETIVEKSFSNNPEFTFTTRNTFWDCLRNQAKPFAIFVDKKLRAVNEGSSEESEGALDKTIILADSLPDWDEFQTMYWEYLANRLLFSDSANIDAERSMISKLKQKGWWKTDQMERMCKDFESKKVINEYFKKSLKVLRELPTGTDPSVLPLEPSVQGIDLPKRMSESFKQALKGLSELPTEIETSVSVLRKLVWPTYPLMDIQLPHELYVYLRIFKEVYLHNHNRGTLDWIHSLSHCVVKANFPEEREMELTVSLPQTVVLLLFNDADKLSFQDIKKATKIEDKELMRILKSLACGEVCLLQKIPEGSDVADDDTFVFNDQFTDARDCIKLNAIQIREVFEDDKTKTQEDIEKDRKYQVQAAIMRIMKVKKRLSHKLLKTELRRLNLVELGRSELKRNIEGLISTEHLERDEDDTEIYKYKP